MTSPRPRYTIRGMMIVTAAVAVLLAIPRGLQGIMAPLSIPLLSPLAARWLVRRGNRRVAAFCLWIPAAIANVSVASSMIAPDGWFQIQVFVISSFVLLPTLFS